MCFFNVLDVSGGKLSVDDLQCGYLYVGMDVLCSFIDSCIGLMDCFVDVIQYKFVLFVKVCICVMVLLEICEWVVKVFDWLGILFFFVCFLLVIVLVGWGNSGGVIMFDGVVIGLEVLCNVDWMQVDVSDCFVYLIVYEYVYIQQLGVVVDVV